MARPLVKKKNGKLYTRPPGIEAKIDAALTQDWATLSKRARVTDPRATDFLPSECLVHLIRDAIRRGDHRIATVLMPTLLVRAEANLLKTVPDSRMRNAEAVREEILSNLQMMFTEDGSEGHEDELDYFECKFLRALRTLRIDHVRAEISRRKELTDLPEAITEDGDVMLEEDLLALLSRKARIGASQEDHTYLPEVIKVLDKLPPDQKRAVVLRRIIGHTEEQAAKICKVDKRTIRYRLARADTQLKKLKEDL
jgi:DNA-directed RNA polymerase specialized sigma24 family protein